MMENNLLQLKQMIEESNYIVFFGGAGVSVESGIPDFRSASGLYKNTYRAEYMLSSDCFINEPENFYDFYFKNMIYPNAKPNGCHHFLTKLQQSGKLKAIITQNIDGLHQEANSKNVLELHGSVLRNYCTSCHKHYSLDQILKLKDDKGIPRCSKCHHMIKPDVVLYGESLDYNVLEQSIAHISKADLLIVGGTSLQVYPAAGLIHYFNGKNIVLMNKSTTSLDYLASLVIREPIGETLSKL